MIKTTDTNKRYYWLKLKDDFFRQKEIKQLRRIAGGEVFIIIYLKMLLRSLRDDGKLYYEGIDENFASELALDIDEDVENVKMTVAYLQAKGILVQSSVDEYELLTAGEMTGSEGYSAERMRRLRGKKQLASHCDTPVTASDEEKREKREEKEKEKEKESREKKRKRFTPPTVEEIKAYAYEIDYNLDAQYFYDYYQTNNWRKSDGKPILNWKLTVQTWKRNDQQRGIDTHARRTDPDNEVVITPEQERIIADIYASGGGWG